MNVPSRVKVFAWRACKNGLPTLQNLKTRKFVKEATCEWCKEDDEDTDHALLSCKTAREVWAALLPEVTRDASHKSLLDIAMQIQFRGNNGDLEKLFLIAWGVCQKPNGGKAMCRWLPSEQGMLKLNVDGAVFASQQRAGVGVILRDDKGEVILSACKKENDINDHLEIELIAILRGLQICLPLGIPQLVIESDSLLLVDEIQNDKAPRSLHGNLVTQIKQLMQRLQKCFIQHSGRLGNSVAHGMARHAWNVDDL
ncbi:hypothetical protein F2P56_004648, partial [Juglans regia]